MIWSYSSSIFISDIRELRSSLPSLKNLLLKVSLGEVGALEERGEMEVFEVKLGEASLMLPDDGWFSFSDWKDRREYRLEKASPTIFVS